LFNLFAEVDFYNGIWDVQKRIRVTHGILLKLSNSKCIGTDIISPEFGEEHSDHYALSSSIVFSKNNE